MAEAQQHSQQQPRRRPSWLLFAVSTLAALVIGAAVTWSAVQVFVPPEDETGRSQAATVQVTQGTVGSTLQFSAVAAWESTTAAHNGSSGVITTIDIEQGEQVSAGQRLLTVSERPVVAGQGTVPAHGTLQEGSRGEVVRQLQQFLLDADYLQGDADGRFGSYTRLAVRAWQADAGFPVTGVVERGDIVWLPTLPTGVTVDEEILAVGNEVVPGEGAIRSLGESPAFTMPLANQQAQLIPDGTEVTITALDGAEWQAVVTGRGPSPESSETVILQLSGIGDQLICDDCSTIPATGQTLLSSVIHVLPPKDGLVVPVGAIQTDASGATFLETADGIHHPVEIVQTAQGMALIEGVDAGTEVVIPAGLDQ